FNRPHYCGSRSYDAFHASLPLGSMPKVLETEERTKHVLGEGFESQVQVSRDDMRVSLHVLPHDLLPDLLSGRSIDVILWEVRLEVLPLHVGTGEGQKDRCLVPRQKARLCLEGIAFVPPEWASPGQLRALAHDLGQQLLVGVQGLAQFFARHVL